MFRASVGVPRGAGSPFGARARVLALTAGLAAAGVLILAMVREQTGTPGFLVGLGLAVLPVAPLLAVFRWLGRGPRAGPPRTRPWPHLLFAFAWGACAAALIAIVANSFATRWIAAATADPYGADQLGSVAIAPVVEESAKAAALALVFLFRRRLLTGVTDGLVLAGFTATGFAFTENILYLGNAFGEDLGSGTTVMGSVTAATFFVRIVLSPFAHPLFTALTGVGFGLAAAASLPARAAAGAAVRPVLSRGRRLVPPLLGLVGAMAVHALWNSSSELGEHGFHVVYGAVMVPGFTFLAVLAVRRRLRPGPKHAAAPVPAPRASGDTEAGAGACSVPVSGTGSGPGPELRPSGPCPAARPAGPGSVPPYGPPGAGGPR